MDELIHGPGMEPIDGLALSCMRAESACTNGNGR